MEVVLISSIKDDFLGKKISIPNHKIMFIPCEREDEGHYISSILNSSIPKLIVMSYCIETGISTHVTKNVYIPKFNPHNRIHLELSNLSKEAHKLVKEYHENKKTKIDKRLNEIEDKIDKIVAKLYRFDDEELKEVKKTLSILRGKR